MSRAVEACKYRVTVRMIKPYCDSYIKKPSNQVVLETLADMILEGQVDDLFVIEES